MEFYELLQQRRACHNFLPNIKIPKKDLLKMVEMAGLSPSGYNAEPWEFIIVSEQKNVSTIAKIAYNQPHIKDSSAVVIVLGDMNIGRNVDSLLENWLKLGYCTKEELPAYRNSIAKVRSPEKRKDMALRNSMLACMTFMLSAESMDYATCPIMGFSQWQLTEFLNIPEDRCIALMIALGKADKGKEKPRLPRKNPKDMIFWERHEGATEGGVLKIRR